MDDFKISKEGGMSDAQFEMLLKHKERKRNQLVGLALFALVIAAVVVVVLALTGSFA